MKSIILTCIVTISLLALAPAAMASNTWYVDGVNGNDSNDCKSPQTACLTIGHAISLASSGDSIMIAAAQYIESNLTLGISLNIIGSSPTTTFVTGGTRGANVFTVSGGATVYLSGLSIKNGFGLGVLNEGTLAIDYCIMFGGRILNQATMTINHSDISGSEGSAIINQATMTINNSTINRNISGTTRGNGSGFGAGIYNQQFLTINNSTITNNHAGRPRSPGYGAGIDNIGYLVINSSTISRNHATGAGSGIYGSATLQNTIVADNEDTNCSGIMTSEGYNLSSDNSCNFNGPGDLNSTDPLLGAFADHGGPTRTISLQKASPAVDAGNPNGCTDGNGHLLTTDQRGYPRPDPEDTSGCDIGAYERQKD
jgi:hypothetical protein